MMPPPTSPGRPGAADASWTLPKGEVAKSRPGCWPVLPANSAVETSGAAAAPLASAKAANSEELASGGWNTGGRQGEDCGAEKATLGLLSSVMPKLGAGPKATWLAAVSWPCSASAWASGLAAMALLTAAWVSGEDTGPSENEEGLAAATAALASICEGVAICAASDVYAPGARPKLWPWPRLSGPKPKSDGEPDMAASSAAVWQPAVRQPWPTSMVPPPPAQLPPQLQAPQAPAPHISPEHPQAAQLQPPPGEPQPPGVPPPGPAPKPAPWPWPWPAPKPPPKVPSWVPSWAPSWAPSLAPPP